ncbi:MAG TPA: FeoA family protein [Anaerolineales bacterium]|nr:FeoA family protein [Anaerolineales bacterium]
MTSDEVSLGSLTKGESGIILRINQKGAARQRLMAMGIVKGVEISVERKAPLGDPIDFLLKDYHLSLRKSEADLIVIERTHS